MPFVEKYGPLRFLGNELPITRDGRDSWRSVQEKWGESWGVADIAVWQSRIVRFDEIKMRASRGPEKEIERTDDLLQAGWRTAELSKQRRIQRAEFYVTPINAYLDVGRLVKACFRFPDAWRKGNLEQVVSASQELGLFDPGDKYGPRQAWAGRLFEDFLQDLAVRAKVSPSISLGPRGPGAGEVSAWGSASVWAHVVEGLFLNATSSKPIPARPMTDTERSNQRYQRERQNKPFEPQRCVDCGKGFETQDRRRRRCGSRCGLNK
jgi:hypothetical protein